MSLYKFQKSVLIYSTFSLVALFVIFPINYLFADFDITKYANVVGDVSSAPKELINPEYLVKRNKITWENIKKCLIVRYEFVLGIKPDVRNEKCYNIQSGIRRALKKFRRHNVGTKISRLDDELVFSEQSPLRNFNAPKKKTTLFCNYLSCGDLNKDGFIYCNYHGVKYGSKVYKRYKKQIDSATKVFTPDDLIDIVMLIMFLSVPVISWVILVKILNAQSRKSLHKK